VSISDGSIPSGIDNDYSNFGGDNLFLERLLHDDHIPLLDILDFSNVVRVFLPFLTYQGVSHRSGTFMKFNVYPNYLNESPMEILSSTCFPMDQ
nr:hypothetical protein [Tanacetum cinerariifolium]